MLNDKDRHELAKYMRQLFYQWSDRDANPEEHRRRACERSKRWYRRNIDKRKAYDKERKASLHYAIYSDIYNMAFPEKSKAKYAKYRQNNKAKRCLWQKTRGDKMKSLPEHREAIGKIYATALGLRSRSDVQVDHIIPLANGGKHEPSNLQIIYSDENNKKKDRLDYFPSVVFHSPPLYT